MGWEGWVEWRGRGCSSSVTFVACASGAVVLGVDGTSRVGACVGLRSAWLLVRVAGRCGVAVVVAGSGEGW